MKHNRALWAFLSVLLLAFSVPGCASQPTGNGEAASTASIFGDWTLESVGGQAVDTLIDPSTRRPDLQISDDGRLTGHSGVNRLAGTIDISLLADGGFATGPLASTRMAGPPEAMALEDKVLEALGRVDRFTISNNQLHLLHGDQVLLVYQAKP